MAIYDSLSMLARFSYEGWPGESPTARVLSEGQAKAKVTAENQAKKLLSHLDCRST